MLYNPNVDSVIIVKIHNPNARIIVPNTPSLKVIKELHDRSIMISQSLKAFKCDRSNMKSGILRSYVWSSFICPKEIVVRTYEYNIQTEENVCMTVQKITWSQHRLLLQKIQGHSLLNNKNILWPKYKNYIFPKPMSLDYSSEFQCLQTEKQIRESNTHVKYQVRKLNNSLLIRTWHLFLFNLKSSFLLYRWKSKYEQ